MLFTTILLTAASAMANIHKETVEYKQGDATLEGYLAYDEKATITDSLKPAVIVVHDWMGNGAYSKKRADMLAELGFIAFAADIYGKGVRPANSEEAGKIAGKYKADRKLLRARAQAALDFVRSKNFVDKKKIAAIGYCFGGGTVLELARSGAPLAGVVSFHGFLDTPYAADAKNIKGRVMILHGGDDPFVPAKDVQALEDEMRAAKVDWQLSVYGGAVHSFTNPEAGNDNSKGAAYNEKADHRSWDEMKRFFKETL